MFAQCLVAVILLGVSVQGQNRAPPGVNPNQYRTQQPQQHHPQQQQYQQVPQQQQQQFQQPPQQQQQQQFQQPPQQQQQQQFQQPPPQQQQFQQPPQQQQQFQQPPQQQQLQQPPQQQQQQQFQQHQPPHHGQAAGQERVLHKPNLSGDRGHIKEHLDVPMDTEKMTEQELQYHYYKMHDADNNNMLDGQELLKSVFHHHDPNNHDHKVEGQAPVEEKIFTEEDMVAMIDPILDDDDRNRDGFIDYGEFVAAQRKAMANQKANEGS